MPIHVRSSEGEQQAGSTGREAIPSAADRQIPLDGRDVRPGLQQGRGSNQVHRG